MPTIDNLTSQIENLRPWVESESGMIFSGEKFSRLRTGVEKVLGKAGERGHVNLDRILADPRRRSLFLERLMAELTIGESFFFRNSYHFQALREQVIPAILKENAGHHEIRIWSAGCAGGEEPHSVAILLDQMLNEMPIWKVHILATDLNGEFLEKARAGRYRQWSFRQTDINLNRDYFSVDGKDFCLTPRIRKMVRFNYLNLVKDVYPSPLTGTLGLDLILFRNVAIYFKREVTNAIIQRFHRALRPGGWLLLGETEVGSISNEGFDVLRLGDATLFRKQSQPGIISNDPLPMPEPPLASVTPRPSRPRGQGAPTAGTAVAPTSLPDWVPLPKLEQAATPIQETSHAEQIHRFLLSQNFDDAERTIDRIANRKDRAMARLVYARGLLACAEIPRAREMLEMSLDEEPLLVEGHLLKATFAEEGGDLAEAEQAYRRALFVDRKCVIGHFHLALVQQQTGDVAGARRSLRIADELAQGHDVHEAVSYGEGVCYGRLLEMIQGIVDC